ncbi:hypothetical protein D3C73_1458490 [compost metagenome]
MELNDTIHGAHDRADVAVSTQYQRDPDPGLFVDQQHMATEFVVKLLLQTFNDQIHRSITPAACKLGITRLSG